MSNRRVSFSPDVNDRPPLISGKHHHGGSGGGMKVGGNKKKVVITGVWAYRSSKFSPVRLLKRLGAKVARALQLVSQNRKSSRKVSSSSSSSSSTTLARSRSYAETLDSHRAEAIEDCIEFLNSSNSCLSRSSSVTTFSC